MTDPVEARDPVTGLATALRAWRDRPVRFLLADAPPRIRLRLPPYPPPGTPPASEDPLSLAGTNLA